MNVLWFSLAFDRADPVLGFATRWVEEVARGVDSVRVLTMRAGDTGVLPANVTVESAGKERGWSEPKRFVHFRTVLRRLGRSGEIDVIFAHMMPLFVVLAAPWARAHRVPQVLWYAHGSTPLRLRLAARLAARVVTSTPGGYRLGHPPAECLGQGIETDRFRMLRDPGYDGPVRVLIAGRLAPVKRIRESIEAVLAAASTALCPWRVVIAGAPATDADARYERELRAAYEKRNVPIEWLGAVPHERMPEVYAGADFLVNLSATGSLDKVLLEALACGCLPVSSNESFRSEADTGALGCLVCGDDPSSAGAALGRLAMRHDLDTLRAAGAEWVRDAHGLDRLADRIVGVLRETVSENRSR